MSTRNIPPRVLALITELRGAGEHDEADDLERRYSDTPTVSSASPAEVADAEVKVIEATTAHDVAVIEATADAAEQVTDAQADAAAEQTIAEDATDDQSGTGDVAADYDPEEDHWFTRSRDGWKAHT